MAVLFDVCIIFVLFAVCVQCLSGSAAALRPTCLGLAGSTSDCRAKALSRASKLISRSCMPVIRSLSPITLRVVLVVKSLCVPSILATLRASKRLWKGYLADLLSTFAELDNLPPARHSFQQGQERAWLVACAGRNTKQVSAIVFWKGRPGCRGSPVSSRQRHPQPRNIKGAFASKDSEALYGKHGAAAVTS